VTDLDVLACVRVADMPEPRVPSRRGRCKRCGMKVWIAHSSPASAEVWCTHCVEDEIAVRDDVEIAKPTVEQIAEVGRYWRRREQ
jgi:hypothetical protein